MQCSQFQWLESWRQFRIVKEETLQITRHPGIVTQRWPNRRPGFASNPTDSIQTHRASKNDDLDQDNTYGGVPANGYQQYNGGNARLGYDFDLGGSNSLNVSGAVRGGQLRVENFASLDNGGARTYGDHSDGTRYAGTLAADAEFGNLTLQGQAVYYKYNIPDEANGGHTGSDQSLTFANYGSGLGAPIPAKGELYAANIAYEIPHSQLGPIDKISVYENYQYLHSGYGDYDNAGSRIGDIQANQVGLKAVAGLVYAWLDYISGKNSQAQFNGPNDGDWHNRINLAIGYYFSGDIIDSGS